MNNSTDRKERVKNWLKDPYNLLFVLLILITIGTRLYYFSLTMNQPTWWDEGDYLAVGKEIALPSPERTEWWGHFAGIRPPLMPLVWAFFIKFGISEPAMRFLTEVVPSILIVLFTYLLGASLFNKKIGLIAGYSFSTYWVLQFYSYRFLTDIPTVLLAMISLYYFWEYYEKQEKPKGLYLAVIFGVLAFLARFTSFLIPFVIALYMLVTRRAKLFKDKHTLFAALVGILTLSVYFIYSKLTLGEWFPAGKFYLTQNATTYNTYAWFLLGYIKDFLGLIPFSFVVVGILYGLFRMAVSYDVFYKQGEKNYNAEYFLFLLLFVQIVYYVFIFKTGTDRWILLWMPAVFMYLGRGLELVGDYLKKYNKDFKVILIIIVLLMLSFNFTAIESKINANLFGGFIPQADQLIKTRIASYKDVRDTGLWLRENTPENAKIMAASIVQNVYYSHRRSYDFYTGTEIQVQLNDSVLDPQGRVISSTYKTLRNETELECKIVRIKPDYLVLHVWEPEFTPEFMYTYPVNRTDILTPMQAFQTSGQTTAIIYKFTGYPVIDPKKVNCTWVYERELRGINSGKTLKDTSPERLIIPS